MVQFESHINSRKLRQQFYERFALTENSTRHLSPDSVPRNEKGVAIESDVILTTSPPPFPPHCHLALPSSTILQIIVPIEI